MDDFAREALMRVTDVLRRGEGLYICSNLLIELISPTSSLICSESMMLELVPDLNKLYRVDSPYLGWWPNEDTGARITSLNWLLTRGT